MVTWSFMLFAANVVHNLPIIWRGCRRENEKKIECLHERAGRSQASKGVDK